MNKKIIIQLVAIAAIIIVIVGGIYANFHKPSGMGKIDNSGAKTITSVAGISFKVNQNFVDQATAVSQISDKINFARDSYYVYEDGKSKYILFNLDKLVIIAQKGTTFDFQTSENKEDALENSSIMGVWLTKAGDKFSCETKNGVTTAKVDAGVTITSDLYADFTGELRTVERDGTEWSLFVGVPGESYEEISKAAKQGIKSIADSMGFATAQKEESTDVYAVTVKGNTSEKTLVAGNESSEKASASSSASSSSSAGTDKSSDDTDTVTVVDSGSASASNNASTKGESDSAAVEKTAAPQKSSETTASAQKKTASKQTAKKTSKGIEANNSNTASKKNTEAYTSNIHSFLSLGDNGITSSFSKKAGKSETPIVKAQKVVTGQDAVSLIQKYIAENPDCGYDYFPAPAGCTWHVMVYSINYDKCIDKPYTNVKLIGADGDPLKYRGVRYEERTHDIFSNETEKDGWTESVMCYYAIPNGCSEYFLRFGDGDNTNGQYSAYYRIEVPTNGN